MAAERDALDLLARGGVYDRKVEGAPVRDEDVAAVGGRGHVLGDGADSDHLVDSETGYVDPVDEAVIVSLAIAVVGTWFREAHSIHLVVRHVGFCAVGRERHFHRGTLVLALILRETEVR